MWLNNFPLAGGISDRFSPKEIILRHRLDAKHHCRAPFGAYCETHEENMPTNSMKTRGLPSICLGPTGNLQGTYNFLNLSSGLVIKRREFVELPAPDSIIQRVNSLAGKNSIASNLIFADRNQVPFDWLDDTDVSAASLDPTPFEQFPNIPAEMPGVGLERHQSATQSRPKDIEPAERDWSQLADDSLANADLDVLDGLPPPPEVIEIDDDDNDLFFPPANTLPLTKVELAPQPKVEHDPMPTLLPTQRSTCTRRAPDRFKDYLFTTVAEEKRQPPPPPYRTAGGTEVDILIKNEE